MNRTFKATVAALMLAVGFGSAVDAGPVEDATAANLRSCMQRAVLSLDDKVSDVRSFVGPLISDCYPQADAFADSFEFRGDAREPLINMAMRAIAENRAPKWWQFWK
jgi:hypothetical protein